MSRIHNRVGKIYGKIAVRSRAADYVSPQGEKGSRWWCECLVCGIGFSTGSCYLGRDRSWQNGCRECSYKHRTSALRKGKGESGFTLMYLSYKHNAKKMGREFTLSEHEFKSITQENCHYCGEKPTQKTRPPINNGRTKEGADWATYTSNGIDRVNNSGGYTYENCVSCCGKCNLMKRSWSVDEFISHVEKIYLYKHN